MPSDERRSGNGYRLARPEREEDWHAFHKIRRDAFQLRRPEEISDPNCHPLLLWHEDRPIGAIQIDNLPNQAAALRLVAIDPSCQACGHGRALLEQAESYVKDLGCRKAVVYSTPEAAGFYSSAGYAEEDWDDTCLGGIVQMLKMLD